MTETTRRPGTHPFANVPLVAKAHIETPIGVMTALATAKGLAGLWFEDKQQRIDNIDMPVDDSNRHTRAARDWLDAFWAGRDLPISNVTLDMHGTEFQKAVWRQLITIGWGRTITYGQMASKLGQPSASRAAGAACGKNPVGVLVPCHRVIGQSGSLTGYAGGLPRKLALLQHEGVLLT